MHSLGFDVEARENQREKSEGAWHGLMEHMHDVPHRTTSVQRFQNKRMEKNGRKDLQATDALTSTISGAAAILG